MELKHVYFGTKKETLKFMHTRDLQKVHGKHILLKSDAWISKCLQQNKLSFNRSFRKLLEVPLHVTCFVNCKVQMNV